MKKNSPAARMLASLSFLLLLVTLLAWIWTGDGRWGWTALAVTFVVNIPLTGLAWPQGDEDET